MFELKDQMIYTSKYDYPVRLGSAVFVFEYWTVKGELIRECVPEQDEYNLKRLASSEGWKNVGGGIIEADRGYQAGVFHDWDEHIVYVKWQRLLPTPANRFKTLGYKLSTVRAYLDWRWKYFRYVTLRR